MHCLEFHDQNYVLFWGGFGYTGGASVKKRVGWPELRLQMDYGESSLRSKDGLGESSVENAAGR